MTDAWDGSIQEHADLQHEIELGNGIPEMRPLKLARQAIKTVGFEIQHEEDLADRPDVVPWYYPLEGDIRKAQTFWDYITVWRMSWSGILVTHNVTWIMEKLGLMPKGTYDVGEALRVAAISLVRGGQQKVSTSLFLGCSFSDADSHFTSCSPRCTSLLAKSPLPRKLRCASHYDTFILLLLPLFCVQLTVRARKVL
jgi:sterol 24-C-methyltransferase